MYSEGITTKVNGVEIHGKNVLLAVENLNFYGSGPFFGFHHNQFQAGNVSE